MRPPPKIPDAIRRSREHLTPPEIDRLIAAARRLGRHGHRDATMILLAYWHGLRVSELIGLRREQLDLRRGVLHVRRRKNDPGDTLAREHSDFGSVSRVRCVNALWERHERVGPAAPAYAYNGSDYGQSASPRLMTRTTVARRTSLMHARLCRHGDNSPRGNYSPVKVLRLPRLRFCRRLRLTRLLRLATRRNQLLASLPRGPVS
jgi:hypothetical protein